MPVTKKLKEIKIMPLAWAGHERDLTALDCLSFCVAATLSFNKFFRMINADGVLLTIALLMKFPITNLIEGCMILGMSYVLHLSLVCTSGEFLDMAYDEIDGPIRLIGKFLGNRNQMFYIFNVVAPGLTQALCFRYDIMQHLKLDSPKQLSRLGDSEEKITNALFKAVDEAELTHFTPALLASCFGLFVNFRYPDSDPVIWGTFPIFFVVVPALLITIGVTTWL